MKERILKKIEATVFKKVNDDEPLLSSGLLDSISLVELAVSIEEEFDVKIPFTEVNTQNFETAVHIEKLILSLQSQ